MFRSPSDNQYFSSVWRIFRVPLDGSTNTGFFPSFKPFIRIFTEINISTYSGYLELSICKYALNLIPVGKNLESLFPRCTISYWYREHLGSRLGRRARPITFSSPSRREKITEFSSDFERILACIARGGFRNTHVLL